MKKPEKQKIEEFLKYLNERLKEDRWTDQLFCEKLGVTVMTLSRWQKGESTMPLDKYFKALEILEIQENLSTIEKKIRKVKINGK